MGLGLRDLEIGCVYAKGNAAKELYLYLGKTRGRNSRYYSDIKEGNTFLYNLCVLCRDILHMNF